MLQTRQRTTVLVLVLIITLFGVATVPALASGADAGKIAPQQLETTGDEEDESAAIEEGLAFPQGEITGGVTAEATATLAIEGLSSVDETVSFGGSKRIGTLGNNARRVAEHI